MDAASQTEGGVAADRAVLHRHAPAKMFNAATFPGLITGHDAVVNGQRPESVVDPTAGPGEAGANVLAIADRETAERNGGAAGRAITDLKNTEIRRAPGGAALHGEDAGPGAIDRDAFTDGQLSAGERNDAGHRKINRVAVGRRRNRIAQRAGAAVVDVRYGPIGGEDRMGGQEHESRSNQQTKEYARFHHLPVRPGTTHVADRYGDGTRGERRDRSRPMKDPSN